MGVVECGKSCGLSEQYPNIEERKIESVRNGALVPTGVLKWATISNREFVQVQLVKPINGGNSEFEEGEIIWADRGAVCAESKSALEEKSGRNDAPLVKGEFNPKLGSCSDGKGRFYENVAAKVDEISKDYPPLPSKVVDGVNRIEKPNGCGDQKQVKWEEKGAWTSVLVSKRSDISLEYVKPNMSKEGGKFRISIPTEIAALGIDKWSNCLVGFFLGKKLPFYQAKSYADRNWSRFGAVGVTSYGRGGYLLMFPDEVTKMDVLEGGTWFIGGQPFFLKLWTPNLSLGMNGITRVPIWVKFYGIPLELWTPKGLSHIASVIGTPLYMDNITESGERLEFAKVCIEMDSSAEFKEEFELEMPSGEIALVKWSMHGNHLPVLGAKQWRQVTSRKNISVPREVSQQKVERKKEGEAPKPCESVNQFVLLSKEGKEKRDVANGEERKSGNGIEEGLEGETKLGSAVLGEEAANEDREERTPTTNAVFLNTFEDSDMGTSSPIYQPFGNLVHVDEKLRLEKEKGSLSKSKRRKLAKKVIQTSAQAILCKIRILKDNSMLFCSIVYGMNSVGEREELWKELIHHANVGQREPWVIIGDFNAVRFAGEKKGGSNKWNSQCEEFNDMCKEADIVSQLFCVLPYSGHIGPLSNVVDSGLNFQGKKSPFMFFNLWAEHEDFLPIVERVWSVEVLGNPMYRLVSKLKALKVELKRLNRKEFWNISERVKFARDYLAQVQERLVVDPVDGALLQEEKLKVERMVKLLKDEESLAKQKSRVKWLREGDANTSYFFKSIAGWRNRNKIVSLEIGEDSVTSDQDRIKEEFVSFYSNLFEDVCASVSYEGMEELITPVILEEKVNSMISEVSKEEIQETMFGMSKDKASGPDGYGAFFFKKSLGYCRS
ncbi:uncharacterized protein LOC116122468 [Pistacia vera]|uniref:uncharacterized protein LOC116122468 n=1 Tax=Pistacia vera TaxID=55513 RepID=UPI001262FE4A|nr:uncharacterized protein LOC116122468 [Pistacia vera]